MRVILGVLRILKPSDETSYTQTFYNCKDYMIYDRHVRHYFTQKGVVSKERAMNNSTKMIIE